MLIEKGHSTWISTYSTLTHYDILCSWEESYSYEGQNQLKNWKL